MFLEMKDDQLRFTKESFLTLTFYDLDPIAWTEKKYLSFKYFMVKGLQTRFSKFDI